MEQDRAQTNITNISLKEQRKFHGKIAVFSANGARATNHTFKKKKMAGGN